MKQLVELLKHLASIGRDEFKIEHLSICASYMSVVVTEEPMIDRLFVELGGGPVPPEDNTNGDKAWRSATVQVGDIVIFLSSLMRDRAREVA